jgi:hypothetical protein
MSPKLGTKCYLNLIQKCHPNLILHEDSARGFNPGYGKPRGAALKVLPTPRTRGAIPTMRNTPVLQNSRIATRSVAGAAITPLARIRGRGRRRGRERSASRVAVERRDPVLPPLSIRPRSCPAHRIWRPFRARRAIMRYPGLKPRAESGCPFGKY